MWNTNNFRAKSRNSNDADIMQRTDHWALNFVCCTTLRSSGL